MKIPTHLSAELAHRLGPVGLTKLARRVLNEFFRTDRHDRSLGGNPAPILYLLNHLPEWQQKPTAHWLKSFGVECCQTEDKPKKWIVQSVVTPPDRKSLHKLLGRIGQASEISLPKPPAPPPTVATKPIKVFKPLNTSILPTISGINPMPYLETIGNAPGMGMAVPTAVEQATKSNNTNSPIRSATTRETGRTLTDQFSSDYAPERREGRSSTFVRSAEFRHAVLQRANGTCEYCGQQGFATESGSLYLETHHVVPLSSGGPDAAWNMVALCPTDHRKAHFAENRSIIREMLLEKLAEHFPELRKRIFAMVLSVVP